MDAERLLYRLNCGKSLRPTELKALVERLETDLDNDDVSLDDHYIMLLVLRRAKAVEHRSLLERYLLIRDPMVGCLVLETLCRDWGFVKDYLERVINLALGVPWDGDDDMRLCAIELLGDFLESKNTEQTSDYASASKKVLQLLLRTIEAGTETKQIREAALSALLRAAGNDTATLNKVSELDWNGTELEKLVNQAVQAIMSGTTQSSPDSASLSSPTGAISRLTGSPATR